MNGKNLQISYITSVIIYCVNSEIFQLERATQNQLSCPSGEELVIKSATSNTEYFRKECSEKNSCNLVSNINVRIEYACLQCIKTNICTNGYCKDNINQLIKEEIKKKISAKRVKRNDGHGPENEEPILLAALSNMYKCMGNVHTTRIAERDNPVTERMDMDVQLNGNRIVRIPVFIKATIFRRHLKSYTSRDTWKTAVIKQMEDMNFIEEYDEKGHLLAHSLGGNEDVPNIVPMAKNLNRHGGKDEEQRDALREFDFPQSEWRNIEGRLKKFLENNPGGRIDWILGSPQLTLKSWSIDRAK
ncbi:uncharacterized protein LOC129573601 isoform X2 [Sitodiplosis mosellana]|uniref:uncharacterized protein LOC129573601 isoform X2 n=1 Tax=Sitodiplosis mosellana TaxID=263140 RepID=UPI0024445E42|nr:uncharacterized protein LOC129573601 isoform X2 [Sitodiplosis mosellana]